MSHRSLVSLGATVALGAAVWIANAASCRPVANQSAGTSQAIKEAERKLIKEVADGLKKRDATLAPQAEACRRTGSRRRTPWGDPDLTGRLFEQRRGRHSVREAGAVRGPPARGHHRSGVGQAPADATGRDASNAPSAPRTIPKAIRSCSGGKR